jgi:hypothetical protein
MEAIQMLYNPLRTSMLPIGVHQWPKIGSQIYWKNWGE